MSEQPYDPTAVDVDFQEILSGIHDEYQGRERNLIEALSIQRGATRKLQQEIMNCRSVIDQLSAEVNALRNPNDIGEVKDAVKVPDRPLRKVRDVPQA